MLRSSLGWVAVGGYLVAWSAQGCGGSGPAPGAAAGAENLGGDSPSGAGGDGSIGGTPQVNVGGSVSTGGAKGAGGSAHSGGGAASTGGSNNSGGGSSTGGNGGASNAGGSSGMGGNSSNGGTNAGGATGMGGTFDSYEIIMSTIFDGNDTNGEQARDIAFDGQGNFVVVGGTSSPDLPTTAGAYDRTHGGPATSGLGNGGDYDVFVMKFDAAGSLLWSTFLGNGSYERAYAVEFGPGGDVYVAGRASVGFPTTPGAYQETFQGDDRVNPPYGEQDGFVTRLSADGSAIVWSTYVGESGRGLIRDMDVDDQGRVYLAMANVSGVFSPAPTTWGPRSTPGGYDAFYGVLAADGQSLIYGNYMGGSADSTSDGGNPCVRVSPSGDVYMLTYSDGADFSCVGNGVFDSTHNGAEDLVLARYTNGTTLSWCTFIGGAGTEAIETHSLAIGSDGNPVIATGSSSANIPVSSGVVQGALSGAKDAYLAIISQDGGGLLAATYFGGSGNDWAEGVGIAPNGDIVFSGGTDSTDVPVTSGALKSSVEGRDGWLVRLSADLKELRYASYFGGSGQDDLRSLWVAPSGAVALVGSTTSANFPAVAGVSGAPNGAGAVVTALLNPVP